MTIRERFNAIMAFEQVDKIPVWLCEEIAEQAVRKWCMEEGYPIDMSARSGLPYDGDIWTLTFNDQPPIPSYMPITVKVENGNKIYYDMYGSLVSRPVNNTATPMLYVYIDAPLKDKEDWEKVKDRFNPLDPRRLPLHFGDEYIDYLNKSDKPVLAGITWGPARGIKNGYMFGFDRYMEMLVESPETLMEIFDFWADYCIKFFSQFLPKLKLDAVIIREDGMGYKSSSMISPEMYRKVYKPYVTKFVSFLKENGVKTVGYYSSGNLLPLLDEIMQTGINLIAPIESAAGMDVVELRKRFPTLRLLGGISKDAVMAGKEEIKADIDRKLTLIKQGGYIPAIDDYIMPDMKYENVRYVFDYIKENY